MKPEAQAAYDRGLSLYQTKEYAAAIRAFEQGFARARTLIEQWERQQNQKPSQPQLFVGTDIRKKLAEVEGRLSARAARSPHQ